MTWNRYEKAFRLLEKPDDDKKPLKWWRGGNLPKLNSFVSCLEEVYHGLWLASRHDIGEMVSSVVPHLRRLGDAAIGVVEAWQAEGHPDHCSCDVCVAVAELHAAWRALDNDVASQSMGDSEQQGG